MSIHKEGRKLLFFLLIILFAVNAGLQYFISMELVLNLVIAASLVIYILVLQFFRNPLVETPQEDGAVYAPADGKVVVIEKTNESEYLKEERIQISIFMSPLNVHVNRAPVSGLVKFFRYHPGKYLVAWHPKSSTENERTTMVIKMRTGIEILVRQVAGAVARRIKWYVDEGINLNSGQEFGFIKFGSRLDIYLPVDADLKVKIGDKTKGGRTVLATLNR
jgi:phosphatidylserine decarboxylase